MCEATIVAVGGGGDGHEMQNGGGGGSGKVQNAKITLFSTEYQLKVGDKDNHQQ